MTDQPPMGHGIMPIGDDQFGKAILYSVVVCPGSCLVLFFSTH